MTKIRLLIFYFMLSFSLSIFSQVINEFPYSWNSSIEENSNWEITGPPGWTLISEDGVITENDIYYRYEPFWQKAIYSFMSGGNLEYCCRIYDDIKLRSPEFNFSQLESGQISFSVNQPFILSIDGKEICRGNDYSKKLYTIDIDKTYKFLTFQPLSYELTISDFKIKLPTQPISEFPYKMELYDPSWTIYDNVYWVKSGLLACDMSDSGGYAISGELLIPQNGAHIILEGSYFEVLTSSDGKNFESLGRGTYEYGKYSFYLSPSVKFIKVILLSDMVNVGSISALSINEILYEDDIPSSTDIITEFPYYNPLMESYQLTNWTYRDISNGASFLNSSSYIESPYLDLSDIKKPYLSFMAKVKSDMILKMEISEDGENFVDFNNLNCLDGKERFYTTLNKSIKKIRFRIVDSNGSIYPTSVNNIRHFLIKDLARVPENNLEWAVPSNNTNSRIKLVYDGDSYLIRDAIGPGNSIYLYIDGGYRNLNAEVIGNDNISVSIQEKRNDYGNYLKITFPISLEQLNSYNYKIKITYDNLYYTSNYNENIYDIDNDGLKELLDGNVIYQIIGEKNIPLKPFVVDNFTMGESPRFCNINNDGIPDIVYIKGGTIALGQADGKWSMVPDVVAPYPCDYNNDGLIDLMCDSKYIYHQMRDGSFCKTEIVASDNDNEYNIWQSNIKQSGMGFGSLNGDVGVPLGGDSDNAVLVQFKSGREFYSLDFNKDGYEDLINPDNNAIMLNRGNRLYKNIYQSSKCFACDLNNDQITDYIYYSDNKVEARIYQADGTIKEQVLLQNSGMDDNIYFVDIDNDGDIDILLPFSSSSNTAGYSYLVICENDSKGNFTINESNIFNRNFKFIACSDFNNDGFYDILAFETPSIYYSNFDVYPYLIIEGRKNNKFEVNEETYFHTSPIKNVNLIWNSQDDNSTYVAIYNSWRKKIPSIKTDKSPEKINQPKFVYDEASGMLKISWDKGVDDLTPSSDLTYALRIGSQPGKGDMFYAAALSDGLRLDLSEGNMGRERLKIINVSGWNPGSYYISVQAIDAKRKGSPWSDEVTFTIENIKTNLYVNSKSITTADTLIVSYDGLSSSAINYIWDFSGGKSVESNATGSIQKVIFAEEGEKEISLSLIKEDGVSTKQESTNIHVWPVNLVKRDFNVEKQLGFFDYDNDGVMNLIAVDGVYKASLNNGNYSYDKVTGLFNIGLELSYLYPIDYNNDGLLDFAGEFKKNEDMSVLINKGNGTFDIKYDSRYFPDKDEFCDWNHDGYLYTWQKENYTTYSLYKYENDGTKTFIMTMENPLNERGDIYCDIYDYNFDNYLDICFHSIDTERSLLYLNKGNFEFEIIEMNVALIPIADFNNDGIIDGRSSTSGPSQLCLSQNGEFVYKKIDMDFNMRQIPYVLDLNNNGYNDAVYNYGEIVVYNYPNDSMKIQTNSLNLKEGYMVLGDYDHDGKCDLGNFRERYYLKNSSIIENEKPTIPQSVSAIQTEDGKVIISWAAAYDKETPVDKLQYNLSVKKKGANGENSYIISPLNADNNDALMSPSITYIYGTQYEFPLTRIPAGEYEIRVQSIDTQKAASDFTEPFIFNVLESPLISISPSTCASRITTARYIGTSGLSVNIDWDGAEVLSEKSGIYEVMWDNPGVKNITIYSEGKSTTTSILVKERFQTSIAISNIMVQGVKSEFSIPQKLINSGFNFRFIAGLKDNKLTENLSSCGIYIEEIKFGTYSIYFNKSGEYTLGLVIEQTECDDDYTIFNNINVVEFEGEIEIGIVAVDENNKYKITWNSSDWDNRWSDVLIYKEGSSTDKYELIGEVEKSANNFVDVLSDPSIYTSRYKIRAKSKDGLMSDYSEAHQPIHVLINKGIGQSFNLMWSDYEGAELDSYKILRGTNEDNLEIIATVSGHVNSYCDKSPLSGHDNYAIEYSLISPSKAKSKYKEQAIVVSRSNIVNKSKAYNVEFVQDIFIKSLENSAFLNDSQKQMHLITEVYPITATCRNVNWSIVSGNDLASISSTGLLNYKSSDKDGIVTVRATSTDGAEIYRDILIPVYKSSTDIEELKSEIIDNINLYPIPILNSLTIEFLDGNQSIKEVTIYNISGNLIFKGQTSENKMIVDCNRFIAGTYIVKVIQCDSIMTKVIIKK